MAEQNRVGVGYGSGFAAVPGRQLRILVAEDDPVTLEILSQALRKRGWEVRTAPDGEVAERCLVDESPDVAVLDVHLPYRTGFQLLKIGRAVGGKRIRMVILTATGQEADRARAYQMGADYFLQKPIDLKALIRTIEELVAQEG